MNRETFEKAKGLETKIDLYENIVKNLERDSREIHLCYWADGGVYESEYRALLQMDKNAMKVLAEHYKGVLEELEKEFENL